MGQGHARDRIGVEYKKNLSDYTVMLVGRTGAGKSSLGNFLTQNSTFKAKASMAPITTSCKAEIKALKMGKVLKVIDTPGFGDMRSSEQVRSDLASAFYEARDGVDAFLFVINAGERVGSDLIESFSAFEEFIHHEHFYEYVIPVFTKVDDRINLEGGRDKYNRERQRAIIKEDLESPTLAHLSNGILNKAKNDWMCISSTSSDVNYNEHITNEILHAVNGIRDKRKNLVCTNKIMEKAKELTDEERERNRKEDEAEIRKFVLTMLLLLFMEDEENIEESFGIRKKKTDHADEPTVKPEMDASSQETKMNNGGAEPDVMVKSKIK